MNSHIFVVGVSGENVGVATVPSLTKWAMLVRANALIGLGGLIAISRRQMA